MNLSTDISELRALIALGELPTVGNRRAKDLVHYFGSAEQAMTASENDWKAIPNIHADHVAAIFAAKAAALSRADREVEFMERHRVQAFYYEEEAYPQRLSECFDCPLLLFGKGNLKPNDGKFVSIVGTRMPTDRGRQLCRDLVNELAHKVPDVTIVSGLAYGIDVTAHKAAIEAGLPTIIIPGHGLDRIYPAAHRSVAVEALNNGGILTEFMSGTEPVGPNFVARNRIIAGLADVVVVVESREKGGSLITADIAFTYSRDLFAFPGRPGDKNAAGCNRLIKYDQAHLIDSADDLIAAMHWQPKNPQDGSYQTTLDLLFADLAPEEQVLMDLLHQNEDGMHVNSLVFESKMPYAATASLLFQMEMRGLVNSLPGGVYKALK